MSYHVAKILPSTQPMRRFANAHSVWARQLRTIIPDETVAYNARGGRAIGNYAPLPFPLGDAGDGLGGYRGFVNPGAAVPLAPQRTMLFRGRLVAASGVGDPARPPRTMMFRGRLVPAAGLGSTLVVL